MARPLDVNRRSVTLAKAAAYVLEHGLAGLSLRPLAKALGTSPRMLLYDFESKENLVAEVLGEIRRREAALMATHTATLDDIWRWISAPERQPFLRLFFEVYVDAVGRDDAGPMVRDWLAFIEESWRPRVDTATATLMIAVVRGLLLDRLATGELKRTDDAFRRFAELL